MKNDFLIALTQLAAEKNLPKEVVLEAVEAALISAFKKDSAASNQSVNVKIVPTTGEVKVYAQKLVVADPLDQRSEVSLAEAQAIKPDSQLGDYVEVESALLHAGRIAAQTAKQVVLQRLREAEREVVFEEFVDREGDMISGVVQRVEPRQVVIDLGKTEAILPASELAPGEFFRPGQRIKAYLLEVHRTSRGPQVVVSRTHRNLLRRLFELEVPEIYNGVVELKAIAREPGSRSKVAVAARQEGVDPVGSCVGMRGIRIQNIVNQLNGEKIDIIHWHPDPKVFAANALSPAQVLSVEVNEKDNTARVVVPDRQLSLAIGKDGINARLAARLTGFRIDIKSASVAEAERAEEEARLEALAAEAQVTMTVGTPLSEELYEVPAAPEEVPPPSAVETAAPEVLGPSLEEPITEGPRLPQPELPADIITLPQEKPVIRFAEEVLAPFVRAPAKALKKAAPELKREEEVRGKPKKQRRGREFREEIEGIEGYEEDLP